MIEETIVTCPCCWESVPLQVDLSGGSAQYTEDCPVCCRPMVVTLEVDGDSGQFTLSVASEDD